MNSSLCLRILCQLVLVHLTLSLTLIPCCAQTPSTVTVIAEQAPVQIGQKVIATVKKGEQLKVVEIKGDWYCVLPSRGWIHKQFLRFETPSPEKASASAQPQADKPTEMQQVPLKGANAGATETIRTLHKRLRGNNCGGHRITPEIVETLARYRCNALRIHISVDEEERKKPVDQRTQPTADNPLAPYAAHLKNIDAILPLCRKNDIQIILTAGDIFGRKIDVLWQNTVEGAAVREHIIAFWSAMSRRYRNEPAIVAYDIKNEPSYTPENAKSWWEDNLPKCIAAIRGHDTSVWIVVEPHIAFAAEFPSMPLIDDARVMYSFHHYWPHGYTHQGVRFIQGRSKEDSRGKYTYPGNSPCVAEEKTESKNLPYWDRIAVEKNNAGSDRFSEKTSECQNFAG